jgi:acyl-CoA thioesterase FadM
MWHLGRFDEAMTAFLTDLGYDIPTMLGQGFDVQLAHPELDWSAGIRHGEEAGVEVRAGTVRNPFSSLRLPRHGDRPPPCRDGGRHVLGAGPGRAAHR